MDESKIEHVRVKTYDGSVESAKEALQDLSCGESDMYHYNLYNRTLFIHSKGLIFQPGDNYHCKIINNEEFKALG